MTLRKRIIMASQKPDKVPRNARQRGQWQRIWGMSPTTTDRMLKTAIAAKLMKVKLYRVRTGAGVRPVPHFWEVK
jgi:hypothetical protein